MAEIAVAAPSSTIGPDGRAVPGTKHWTQIYHSGGFVRFADVTLDSVNGNDDFCTYPFTIEDYRQAAIYIVSDNVTIGNGATVDYYVQTTYDGGLTWVDMQNVHFVAGQTPDCAIAVLGLPDTVTPTVTKGPFTEGSLAADTGNNLMLGNGLRLRIKAGGGEISGVLRVSMLVK
jgi:hypothetical protein